MHLSKVKRINQNFPKLIVHILVQIFCWWHPNQGIQEQQGLGSEIPIQPAYEDLQQLVERRRLGHKGWFGENRLVESSLHSILQGLPHRRLRGLRRSQVLRQPGPEMVGPAGVPRPWRRPVAAAAMGSEKMDHLQLLYWPHSLPDYASWMQERPRSIEACFNRMFPKVGISYFWLLSSLIQISYGFFLYLFLIIMNLLLYRIVWAM